MFRSKTVHYTYGVRPSRLQKVSKRLGWLVAVFVVGVSIFSFMHSAPIAEVNAQQILPELKLPERPRLSPFEAPTAFSTKSLDQTVSDWIKAHPDKDWSVAVTDIATGENYSNSNQTYAPASLYKLLLLPALFEKYDLKDMKKIKVADQTLNKCVEKMLVRSDNPCGEAIANDLLGWRAIEQALQKQGYRVLDVNDPGQMRVNAPEFSQFLVDFYQGKLVPRKQRNYVLGLLENQVFAAGIPAGCQSCSRVMNKTGDKNKVRHDSAIIEIDDRLYSLVILSNGGTYADIADLTHMITGDIKQYSRWQ